MLLTYRWILLPALLTGLLLLPHAAVAVTPEVEDRAQYFAQNAIDKANAEILAIKKESSKDLIIETFETVPAEKKANYDPNDAKKKEAFFVAWASERAQAGDIQGIYILLCKSEHRVQIHVDPETLKKDFTSGNVSQLRGELLAKFKRKEFDEGLLSAVKYVHQTLQANRKPAGAKTEAARPETGKSATAAADSPFIRDQGEMFSARAINEATGIIREIKRRDHREVQIDTFREKPANKDFSDWERELARARDLDGIQVLICRQPAHIGSAVGNETRKVFTSAHQHEFEKILKARFNEKKFDEGLVEGVRYIQRTLDAGTRGEAAPTGRGNPAAHTGIGGGATNWGGLICMMLVLAGVVWLVIGMVRAFTGSGGYGAGGPGMGGYGGGGGGFMSGLMGGLFGAMAGNWLYHNMFGSGSGYGSSTAYCDSGDAGGGQRPDDGQDYSTSGTDYDEGGDSGGDAGGDYGDSGGGDAGGDYGGGGDFGGGGGGGGDY